MRSRSELRVYQCIFRYVFFGFLYSLLKYSFPVSRVLFMFIGSDSGKWLTHSVLVLLSLCSS